LRSSNFGDLSLKASITLPELQVSTNYDVNGRLLVVPLTGKGVLEGTFSECNLRGNCGAIQTTDVTRE